MSVVADRESVRDSDVEGKARLETAYKPIEHSLTLAQRRWQNFKNNKRGFYSAWIFSALFIFCLLGEFFVNDKPLLLSVDGELYFPVVFTYPESMFGGDFISPSLLFETEAVYRDPFLVKLIEDRGGWMLWPLVHYANNTVDLYMEEPAPTPPSMEHIFGTDDIGRDVFARVVYGFRLSILFGLALTICSTVIGITAGAIQGYFGGWIDLIFQRLIEMWANLPILFLLIILASMVEPNVYWMFGLLLLFSWMALVGVVRAEFLRARNLEYVRAARALGVSDPTIMYKHVLPNAMVAALTMVPFVLTTSVIMLTALDFLGFGLPPDAPSLGRLIKQATGNLQAPWLGLTAFFSIGIMLTLLIFVGEAVRDAFDPRKAIR
jgi:microcin C transport system permease protein